MRNGAAAAPVQRDRAVPGDMVRIPGGTFLMGSDLHYPEEGPRHHARIGAFDMDVTTVTNAQFAAFVAATGHVTVAERPLDPALYPGADAAMLAPGALVFRMTEGPVDTRDISNWWRWTPGAHWRAPEGPGSTIEGREDHPAVQVAFEDAAAYARWAGKDLPTEAEWEFAALHGLPAGGVWEWTASPFLPYPGFAPQPYAEYSAPWFGDHRVLRGASWATSPRLAHPRFRNFYLPSRHDPFCGFRSCALAT